MNVSELLKIGYDKLKKQDIDTYMLDTQLILCKVLNVDKLFIIINRDFEVEEALKAEYIKLIELREKKMPVKYILGNAEFMGIDFIVKEGVLIPRGDTEILVEEALKEIDEKGYETICDVCSGSGAIGISIAYYRRNSKITCYDISDIALDVASENIKKHQLQDRVEVRKSDLLQTAMENRQKFDMIVSNPPYIKRAVIDTLMEDVKNYEPFIALCGGEDGLDFYRTLVRESKELLNKEGALLFEIGYDQGKEVMELLIEAGFHKVKCIKDLAKNDRVVTGKLI